MMGALLKIGGFIADKFTGKGDTPARYVFMKRVTLFVLLALLTWAIIDPESLGMRLEHASEVLPDWFQAAVATILAGIWF